MTLCGGWSAYRHERDYTRVITLHCRSWQCTDCRPRRLSQLMRLAASGAPTSFLTLTVNPAHGQDAQSRARELVEAFRAMLKRARRRWRGSKIEYLAVFEATKAGEPHLHVIMRAPYIPQAWISNTMRALIEAPIVDIRRVGSKRGVARYVAKYVAKGPKSFGTLKRYWCSQRYALDRATHTQWQHDYGSGWHAIRQSIHETVSMLARNEWIAEWVSEHECVVLNCRKAVPP